MDYMDYIDNRNFEFLLDTGMNCRVGIGIFYADIAHRDLQRFYKLVESARARLDGLFSDNEIACLLDCTTAGTFQAGNLAKDGVGSRISLLADTIVANVEDSFSLGIARWEVDLDALTTKLRNLDELSLCALVDALERFWLNTENTVTLWSEVLGPPVPAPLACIMWQESERQSEPK